MTQFPAARQGAVVLMKRLSDFPVYPHAREMFCVSMWSWGLQSGKKKRERIIRAEEAFLHPNITTGSELLFSHSHHNSFILTALRRRRMRTNLHLLSSDGALCVFVHICICTAFHFTLTVSDLAPPPPASLSELWKALALLFCLSPLFLCIHPSLNPHSLQLVTHPLFCIFSLDVAAQLTRASSQAEHHCEQRSPAAGVGAVCVCVWFALQWAVKLLLN